MTIEYIRYHIDEQTCDAFEMAYAAAAVPLAASAHCNSFELSRCVEEPNRYILRIEWDSRDGHMQGFRGSDEFKAFFAHIRLYVDAIDEMQHYETTAVTGDGAGSEKPPSLYEWAGGLPALSRMINAFYDRVEQTELFDNLFPEGVTKEHRDHVIAWWAEVFGGPPRYTAELGGYENMLDHHRNLAITAEQRATFVAVMSLAADDAGLPGDPEFRSALLAYLEWGTRLALENSQPGADLVEQAPVPRWGWGEAPPYQPS